jgi:hypothetical protein
MTDNLTDAQNAAIDNYWNGLRPGMYPAPTQTSAAPAGPAGGMDGGCRGEPVFGPSPVDVALDDFWAHRVPALYAERGQR